MLKLHELFDKRLIEGDVGIEIECEGAGFRMIDTDTWTCEDDGSLRGKFPESRIEYILKKPIPVEGVVNAVEELQKHIPLAVPSFSYRTSVHIHVNVLALTDVQIKSFIYTYLLLEEPLMNFCGSERKGNRFCLRLQDADKMTGLLQDIFAKDITRMGAYIEDDIRYSAMNLYPINKYGSVEFRGMRGTLETQVIDVWAKALVSIRNFACHQVDCIDVHDLFVKLGPIEFIKLVLGDLAPSFMYKKIEAEMTQSYHLSINLPHIYNVKIAKPKPKPRAKKVEIKEEIQIDF